MISLIRRSLAASCGLSVALMMSPLAAQEATAPVQPTLEQPSLEQPTLAQPNLTQPSLTQPGLTQSAPVTTPGVAAAPTSESPSASATASPTATPERATVTPAEATPTVAAPAPTASEGATADLQGILQDSANDAMTFLRDGGPSIWAIAALSVVTLALILWKIWRLALIGAWSRGKAGKAVTAFETGDIATAQSIVAGRRGIRSQVVAAAIHASRSLPEDRAREETTRVAKRHLASAGTGLGALELIATIAPLLGLLGTVLGMIAAFQALQAAGSKADPALLAGGIWEALLTTAAGMAVAIPASAALTWFESVITRIRQDLEDSATRIFVAQQPHDLKLAAE
ncbi:MotA/TolQ/ExbB proton channel family protein [Phaeobacter sp.]|uniref:MotA/TolQ/ExbB proton channel family protein n=1 Tax=Phaeobacter sp. TaxID=1902409 RepID=UPI00260135EE|nr:MotA/TolQ/ExbB proton channel family protein [Phaeobacter sp.]